MIKNLFILSVIALPWTDFLGLSFLGEMQHDLSAHLMILAVMLAIPISYTRWYNIERYKNNYYAYKITPDEALLRNIFLLFLVVILASFLANFSSIMSAYAFQRSGITKLVASTGMIVFGFSFAFFTMSMGRKFDWYDMIIYPMAIGILVAAFFATFEGLGLHVGSVFKSLQMLINEITHCGFKGHPAGYNPPIVFGGEFGYYDEEPWHTRSVSFEAPSFADYLGLAWPWVYGGYIISTGERKRFYQFVLLLGLLLMFFSGSRTGYLFIALTISISGVMTEFSQNPTLRAIT